MNTQQKAIMRYAIRGLAIATAFALLYAACNTGAMFTSNVSVDEPFHFARPVAGHHAIHLDNLNGDVVITAVDGLADADISGTLSVGGSSEEEARKHVGDVKVTITENGGVLNVTTDGPGGDESRSYSVDYRIRVPKEWKVDVDNTNGDVTLRGMKAGATIDVTNGDVVFEDVSGAMIVDATNGSISGNAHVPPAASCTVESTNGDINVRLSLEGNADCRCSTTNGNITLEVPRATSAALTASSSTGDIDLHNLDVASLERSNDEDFEPGDEVSGTLGGGAGKIGIETTNGDVLLRGY